MLSRELEIGSWEMSRTHWAVKDVDLGMVSFYSQTDTLPSPKVFKLDNVRGIDDDLVSVNQAPIRLALRCINRTESLLGSGRMLGKPA